MTKHPRRRPKPAVQLELPMFTHGGSRRGAGRPRRAGRSNTPHRARPDHRSAHPVHATLRTARFGLLRSQQVFPSVQAALANASGSAFRVVHYSVQSDHLHLVVEAEGKAALSSGMRGLAIRVARAVNKRLGRRGRLWGDRWHGAELRSPRQVRNCLVYVLMNHKKHQPVHGAASPRTPWVDPCSSAPWFDGFHGHPPPSASEGPRATATPRTWLARVGWRRLGALRIGEAPRPSRS